MDRLLKSSKIFLEASDNQENNLSFTARIQVNLYFYGLKGLPSSDFRIALSAKKNDDSVEVAYYINGEKTEKKEYESTVKEKTKGSPYVLGQDNDITDETIKELSEGKYKEASKK